MSKAIYVELDALLDTRIATIAILDPEMAKDAIMSPKYHNRQRDKFSEVCGIDDELYQKAYNERSSETLKHATLSHFSIIMMNIVRELEKQADNIPNPESFHVDLNVWPYELADQERIHIELAVQRFCGIQTTIRSINVPYSELTPKIIKDNYPIVMMYNFNDWLSIHPSVFGQYKIPQNTFYVPRIHYNEPIPEDDRDVQDFVVTDPYERASRVLALFLNVEFIDIKNFGPLRHWELDNLVEAMKNFDKETHTPTEPA